MFRILVVGCPGAGKSTFSRRLHAATGLPLHYLDKVLHRPDRTRLSHEEFDRRLDEMLAGERWILDGNYRRTMERRMEAADTLILLDYPVEVCLAGAEERVGTLQEDMPWKATLDDEFRQRILHFADDDLPAIYALIEKWRGRRRIIIFHSREEADLWLAELGE